MRMAREQASGERAEALFTGTLRHIQATQTRHGRSNATNNEYTTPFKFGLESQTSMGPQTTMHGAGGEST